MDCDYIHVMRFKVVDWQTAELNNTSNDLFRAHYKCTYLLAVNKSEAVVTVVPMFSL